MSVPAQHSAAQYEICTPEHDRLTVRLSGRLDAASAHGLIADLHGRLQGLSFRDLIIDLAQVQYFDDFGALVLLELRKLASARRGQMTLECVPAAVEEMLTLVSFSALGMPRRAARVRRPNMFVRLGEACITIARDTVYMVNFVGAVCLALAYVVRHPRSLRRDDVLLYMQRTGVDALPIVGLISFLLGLIMAFMSSVQLKQFGANIYVASLVSLSMCRELGPIMTAIIVAGRSGSAFAAEIGTMQVSEEVDALVTMGFDPTRFLVIPKLIAAATMVPILTLFADVFAIAGGLIVGVGMLDLTASAYMSQTVKTLSLFDVSHGLLKSVMFAVLIAWIGCLRGFRVRGGAAAVGQATTSAVVSSLFLIIVTDALFAVVLRYWG